MKHHPDCPNVEIADCPACTEMDRTEALATPPCSPVASLREYGGRMLLRFQPHGYEYPIELPVITSGSRDKTGAWTWNGVIEKPTLRPSIKTTHGGSGNVSHLWLNDGLCQHLDDSTEGLAGQTLPLQILEEKDQTEASPHQNHD